MWCNQIFSLMKFTSEASYKIENIIVADNYTIANQIAQTQYGVNGIAVDTTRYPVCIGDFYKDGSFYSQATGEEILPNPSEEEQIAELKAIIADLAVTQADILFELDTQ